MSPSVSRDGPDTPGDRCTVHDRLVTASERRGVGRRRSGRLTHPRVRGRHVGAHGADRRYPRAVILYLHGFASGPGSTKGRALEARFTALGVPFQRADLTPGADGFERSTPLTMLAEAERLVALHRPRVLMGSRRRSASPPTSSPRSRAASSVSRPASPVNAPWPAGATWTTRGSSARTCSSTGRRRTSRRAGS